MAVPPDSTPLPPIATGDILADKYRVERVLGAGGMGVVVQATHLELQEKVAVKFLHPEALESPEAAARFLREARVAVKIRSENVARVIDVGRLDNGAPYMVMEYLEGEDLAAQIQRGALPVATAADYVIQACAAMAEAHKAGVVHRDLKPANLFVVQRSDGSAVVKVLDFGISKLSVPDLSEAGLTKTATMMGSPFYMSPEQMRSARDVDVRTDIWALGVILFELLTASNAFGGTSLPELVANIMTSSPRDLGKLRPEVPEELRAIVFRCLEKDPEKRFQTVADLAQALAPYAGRDAQITVERLSRVAGVAPIAEAATINTATAVSPLGRTNTSWSETQKTPGSRRSLVLGATVLLVAGGAGAAWFSMHSSVADTAASAEPASPPAVTTAAMAPASEPVPTPAPSPEPTVAAAPSDSNVAVTADEPEPEPEPAIKPASALTPRHTSAVRKTASPTSKPSKPAVIKQAPEPEPTPPKPEKKPAPAVKNPLSIELK